MLAGQPVYLGAPDHIRDYMFIDDHVDAYVRAFQNPTAADGEAFNVSPGNPISNVDLANQVARVVGFGGKVVSGSYPPGYPIRPAHQDTDYIVLDSSKIRSKLGWKPSVGLEEGLKRVVSAWKQSSV